MAYAPSMSEPGGFYNRNYDAASSQTTFAPSIENPSDVLAQLAEQKSAQRERVTLETGTPVQNPIARLGENFVSNVRTVVSGVADFFASIFSPRRNASAPPSDTGMGREGEAMRLALESGNLLVPGNPTEVPSETPEGPVAQAPDAFHGTSSRASRTGGSSASSSAEAIAAIANAPEASSTIELALASTSTSTPEVSVRNPLRALFGDFGSQSSGAPQERKPVGVAAAIRRAVSSAISRIAGAISAGIAAILSWF